MVIFKPLVENFTEPLTPISEDLFASTVPNMGAFYQGRLYIDTAPLRAMNVFALSDTEMVDALLLKSMLDKPRASWPKALARSACWRLLTPQTEQTGNAPPIYRNRVCPISKRWCAK